MLKACNVYLSEKDFDGLCIKYGCNSTELINLALKNLLNNEMDSLSVEQTKKDMSDNKYKNYMSGMSNKLNNINANKESIIKYYLVEYNIDPENATQKTLDNFDISDKYLSDLKTKFRSKFNIPDLRFVSKPNKHKKFTIDKYYLISEKYNELKKHYQKDIDIIPIICKMFDISNSTFKRFKSWYKKEQ